MPDLQWLDVAALAGLAAVLLWGNVGPVWQRVRGWFADDAPTTEGEALALIRQLRVLVCDDEPSLRDAVNKHLDEIESRLSGTVIEGDA